MTLQQLEYIISVYRFKHFAKAAEHCNVTQPTLSSMIQKLEDELGVKIFDRKKQPIATTAPGKLVIEHAWRVLQRARRLKEAVEEEKHSLTGTFKIGIIPTIAPYLIPRFFPQLMSKYPNLDVRITEMKTEELKYSIKTGDIDVGILALLDDMDDFDCTHLFYEQFFVYVSENDILQENTSIKTSDLTDEFLWLLDEGHCFRDQLVKFCHLKSADKSKKAYSLGSIETFMRMVESGKGVTFIPELALYQLTPTQKKLVRPFAIPVPTRDVTMITSKNFIRHSIKELITKEIQEAVPSDMLTLKKTIQKII